MCEHSQEPGQSYSQGRGYESWTWGHLRRKERALPVTCPTPTLPFSTFWQQLLIHQFMAFSGQWRSLCNLSRAWSWQE